ncbi:unnamed protein product [Paramecium octaurelia]|uniref:Uncharacterized protein n=1 Tax=Paramecium octaurelia TaxID=43137 RepID=A0A8S1SI73_PAROT|nr:unnamed protein product [Paramecium octaurelia]
MEIIFHPLFEKLLKDIKPIKIKIITQIFQFQFQITQKYIEKIIEFQQHFKSNIFQWEFWDKDKVGLSFHKLPFSQNEKMEQIIKQSCIYVSIRLTYMYRQLQRQIQKLKQYVKLQMEDLNLLRISIRNQFSVSQYEY